MLLKCRQGAFLNAFDSMQGNVTDYNAMDVMFGNELPHMGLMGHATSGFIDAGLDYGSLNYPQMQVRPAVCTENTDAWQV